MYGTELLATALQALLLTSCLSGPVVASPVNVAVEALAERQSGGGRFPFPNPKFILSNYIRPNMRRPGRPGVFYNVDPLVLNRTQIQAVAASLNAISLYDVYYPDNNVNAPFNQYGGPYREYNRQNELRDWFRYTSRVYAQTLTNNVAYLIWDGQRAWQNNAGTWTAIWSTDEFDAILRGQTAIDTVYLVDPVTLRAGTRPYWRRGDPVPPGWSIPTPGANSESNDTANSNPNGPANPPRKRELDLSLPLTERDAEPAEFLERNGHKLILKRAPNIDGIEQDVESIFSPGQDAPWSAGLCSFHFIHAYLGNNFGSVGSNVNLTLFDDSQTNVIGGVIRREIQPGASYAMPSRLPYTLVIRPGTQINNPIQFNYAGLSWTSSSSNCKTGKYDGGIPTRQGDCSFACNQFQ